MNWTDAQREAIAAVGRSLLVSAGAGSGKTAVLAERCARLTAEADPPVDLDRILVVTFTDAAAAEMRQRIGDALRRRSAENPADRCLQRQLALLDVAAISTLHAFCRRVLLRFFARVDLDPGFEQLDEQDDNLLCDQALCDVFHDVENAGGPPLDALDLLIEETGRGSDSSIRESILNLHRFLESLVDPSAWLDQALSRFDNASPGRLSDGWAVLRRNRMLAELRLCEQLLDVAIAGWSALPDGAGRRYVDVLADVKQSLPDWIARAQQSDGRKSLDVVADEIAGVFKPLRKPARRERKKETAAQSAALDQADEYYGSFKKTADSRLLKAHAAFHEADWARGIFRIAPHVRTIVDLQRRLADRYAAAKKSQSAVSYNDLERLTLRLLRDERDPDARTPVARWLADRYDHVLVDEFQDINPVQAEIITRISREFDDRPNNLFVVGDVRQSIYRFRLADPGQFLKREELARDPARNSSHHYVGLRENFRSAAPLLDFVNALFERLMSPDLGAISFAADARLLPGTDEQRRAAGPAVELNLLDDSAAAPPDESDTDEPDDADNDQPDAPDVDEWERIEREAYWIALRILQLRREPSPPPFRDIVVLMRAAKILLPLLVRTLERMGIPTFGKLTGGLLDAVETNDVLSLLSLLDNGRQDIPLAAFLRGPLAPRRLNDSDLVAIRANSLHGRPFHEAVADYARNGPDENLRAALRGALENIARWRSAARRTPLPALLTGLYRETGYDAYVAALPNGPQRRANLDAIHQYACRFSTFRRQGLNRFLTFVNELLNRDDDLGATPPLSGAADVVRVMTIHQAKGLEFPIVFVAGLGRPFNLKDRSATILFDRCAGFGIRAAERERRVTYPTLPHHSVAERIDAQSRAEEMRMLYVAFTRAKQRLILVGTARPDRFGLARDTARPSSGPLPLTVRLAARSYLDWIVPALSRFPPPDAVFSDDPATFGRLATIRRCSADAMRGWKLGTPFSPAICDRLKHFAALKPAESPKPGTPTATIDLDALFDNLSAQYPHTTATQMPAILAASTLKHVFDSLREPDDPLAALPFMPTADRLPRPNFLLASDAPSTDSRARGTLTHRFLQGVDLAAACDRPDLRRQLDRAVADGRWSRAEADAVNLDDVAWFFQTDLGRRLRAAAARSHREAPFVYVVDPLRLAPLTVSSAERILVRGIIDCFFTDAAGVALLDYKTDALTPADVPARACLYESQLRIYADALRDIWALKTAQPSLVFLSARQVVTLPDRPAD